MKFGENNYAAWFGCGENGRDYVFSHAWGLNNLRIQMQNNKSNQSLVRDLETNQAQAEGGQAGQEVNQLGERFSQALETLGRLKFQGKAAKALYELPRYIIIGPPGSGKTTALVNLC